MPVLAAAELAQALLPAKASDVDAWLTWVAVWLYSPDQALPLHQGVSRDLTQAWAQYVLGDRQEPVDYCEYEDEFGYGHPWTLRLAANWRTGVRQQWSLLHQDPTPEATTFSKTRSANAAGHVTPLEQLELAVLHAVFASGALLSLSQRRAWAGAALQMERMGVFMLLAPDAAAIRTILSTVPPKTDDSFIGRHSHISLDPLFLSESIWNNMPAALPEVTWEDLSAGAGATGLTSAGLELAWLCWARLGYSAPTLLVLCERANLRGGLFPGCPLDTRTWLNDVRSEDTFVALAQAIDPLAPSVAWSERLDTLAAVGPGTVRWDEVDRPWVLNHLRNRVASLEPAHRDEVFDLWLGQMVLRQSQFSVSRDAWPVLDAPALEAWAVTGDLTFSTDSLAAPKRWRVSGGRWVPFRNGVAFDTLGWDSGLTWLLGPQAVPAAPSVEAAVVAGVPDAFWEWLWAVREAPAFVMPHVLYPWPHAEGQAWLECGLREGMRAFPRQKSFGFHVTNAFCRAAEALLKSVAMGCPPFPAAWSDSLMPLWRDVGYFLSQTAEQHCAQTFAWRMRQPLPTSWSACSAESQAWLRTAVVLLGKDGSPSPEAARDLALVSDRLLTLWRSCPAGGPCDPSLEARKAIARAEEACPAAAQFFQRLWNAIRLEAALSAADGGLARARL